MWLQSCILSFSSLLIPFMIWSVGTNFLAGYNMTPEDLSSTDRKVLTFHRIIEAFKFAYAKRTDLADEEFEESVKDVRDLQSKQLVYTILFKLVCESSHKLINTCLDLFVELDSALKQFG